MAFMGVASPPDAEPALRRALEKPWPKVGLEPCKRSPYGIFDKKKLDAIKGNSGERV